MRRRFQTLDYQRLRLFLAAVARPHGWIENWAVQRFLCLRGRSFPFSQLLFNLAGLLNQALELHVNAFGALFDEFFLRTLRFLVSSQQSDYHLLIWLLLLEHEKTHLEALWLCVVKQELTEIHEATSSAHKYTSALYLDGSDFCSDKVSTWGYLDKRKACCKFVDQTTVFALKFLRLRHVRVFFGIRVEVHENICD